MHSEIPNCIKLQNQAAELDSYPMKEGTLFGIPVELKDHFAIKVSKTSRHLAFM